MDRGYKTCSCRTFRNNHGRKPSDISLKETPRRKPAHKHMSRVIGRQPTQATSTMSRHYEPAGIAEAQNNDAVKAAKKGSHSDVPTGCNMALTLWKPV